MNTKKGVPKYVDIPTVQGKVHAKFGKDLSSSLGGEWRPTLLHSLILPNQNYSYLGSAKVAHYQRRNTKLAIGVKFGGVDVAQGCAGRRRSGARLRRAAQRLHINARAELTSFGQIKSLNPG